VTPVGAPDSHVLTTAQAANALVMLHADQGPARAGVTVETRLVAW
jgi:molybdopterin biosynthesis enzyme